MKKVLFFILFFVLFVFSCSRNEQEPKTFYDEAVINLKKSVNFQEGMQLQNIDTIFTAKKNRTDSIFMIGLKFDLVSGYSGSTHYEYIYKNLENKRKELLISTVTDESIENKAKELQEKSGGDFYNTVFMYSAAIIEIKGKEL